MARAPISLVENQNPQVSEDELMAEVEIEAPGSLDMSGMASDIDIEMEDDGGAMIDFDPRSADQSTGFDDNLAEDMDDRVLGAVASELMSDFDANKASRQEWEDAYANGWNYWVQLLGEDGALSGCFWRHASPFGGSCCAVSGPSVQRVAAGGRARADCGSWF